MESEKDVYLEGMYSTLEMCDFVIQNADRLDDKVARAKKLREETLKNIERREAIPREERM